MLKIFFLDSILLLAYPHISRARKVHDMKVSLTYDKAIKLSVLPELLPMGKEDN